MTADTTQRKQTKPKLPLSGEDCELVAQILSGNVNAYEIIVHRHQNMVARIVSRHVPHHAVEDVCQDTFTRAYVSLATYQGKQALSHWLAKISTRACHDYWRTAYRNREDTLTSMSRGTTQWLANSLDVHSKESFEQQARQDEAIETLNLALDGLSPEDRMVINLTHLEGHSVNEAADLLGWSTANVKVRAFRARKKLKKILEKLIP